MLEPERYIPANLKISGIFTIPSVWLQYIHAFWACFSNGTHRIAHAGSTINSFQTSAEIINGSLLTICGGSGNHPWSN